MNKRLIIFLCLAIASGLASCEWAAQKSVEIVQKINISEDSAKEKINESLAETKNYAEKEEGAKTLKEDKEDTTYEKIKPHTPKLGGEIPAGEYGRFRDYALETTCLLISGQQKTLAQEQATMKKHGYSAEDVKRLMQKYPDVMGQVGERAGIEGCSRFLPPPKDKAGVLQDIILEITCKSIAGKVKDETEQLKILEKYGYTKESFREAMDANPEVEQNLGPRLLECKDFIER